MGTRNLTGVWIDGDFKVAQYGGVMKELAH